MGFLSRIQQSYPTALNTTLNISVQLRQSGRRVNLLAVTLLVLGCLVSTHISAQTISADTEEMKHAAREMLKQTISTHGVPEAVHLEGSVTIFGKDIQHGTIKLESSSGQDWKEIMTVGGRTTHASHINGQRANHTPEADRPTHHIPSIGADFLPVHTVLVRHSDPRMDISAPTEVTIRGQKLIHIRLEPTVLKIIKRRAPPQSMPSAPEFYAEDVYIHPATHLISAIRYLYAVEPVHPEAPSFCKASDGTILTHPAGSGSISKIDCASAHSHIPVPIEVRYSNYQKTAVGTIPMTIERYDGYGNKLMRIDLNSAVATDSVTTN